MYTNMYRPSVYKNYDSYIYEKYKKTKNVKQILMVKNKKIWVKEEDEM